MDEKCELNEYHRLIDKQLFTELDGLRMIGCQFR